MSSCLEADNMYFPNLAERVRFFKKDDAGMIQVSTYFEEREAKAVEKAVAKAVREERRAVKEANKAAKEANKALKETEKKAKAEKESLVMKLIELGKMTREEIASCTGVTLRRVQFLAAKRQS
ncbi:MAG: hypothetical protein IJT58_09170 [Synergistaceae bacterium]|nr:hypothetical protein [Synergistaceae bacterium]